MTHKSSVAEAQASFKPPISSITKLECPSSLLQQPAYSTNQHGLNQTFVDCCAAQHGNKLPVNVSPSPHHTNSPLTLLLLLVPIREHRFAAFKRFDIDNNLRFSLLSSLSTSSLVGRASASHICDAFHITKSFV
ncbi:unnamed protein product [Taenia asiatica]|uniref:Ovule protein n=1 Tax=Taenia asiatica TaxID=60517 RepID=A0A0R3VXU2_TAEAS|nr:unnamed protein product [Taenia asiatica]